MTLRTRFPSSDSAAQSTEVDLHVHVLVTGVRLHNVPGELLDPDELRCSSSSNRPSVHHHKRREDPHRPYSFVYDLHAQVRVFRI